MKLKYTKKEITEFLRESNAIEGVYDTKSLLQAKKAWNYLEPVEVMTTYDLLMAHKILMLHQKLQPEEKGYFRKCEVSIGGRLGLTFPLVPEKINHWVMNVNDIVNNGQLESEIFLERIIKEHHVKYEKIHPFVDGNGRTGRMFMNWTRMQLGLPILIIKADERWSYYEWFNEEENE